MPPAHDESRAELPALVVLQLSPCDVPPRQPPRVPAELTGVCTRPGWSVWYVDLMPYDGKITGTNNGVEGTWLIEPDDIAALGG
jgi:hypothetical protein